MGEISPEILRLKLSKYNFSQIKLSRMLGITASSVGYYFKNGCTFNKFEEIGRLIGMPDAEIAAVIQGELKNQISAFDTLEYQITGPQNNEIGFVVNEPEAVYEKQKKEFQDQPQNISKQLVDLATLFQKGLLTPGEFSEAKAKVLKI
jgi:transcriptional regulator with XRE-family HTH domain